MDTLSAAVLLFLIMDPIGNLPVFVYLRIMYAIRSYYASEMALDLLAGNGR